MLQSYVRIWGHVIPHRAQGQRQGKRFASYAPLTPSEMWSAEPDDSVTHDSPPPLPLELCGLSRARCNGSLPASS